MPDGCLDAITQDLREYGPEGELCPAGREGAGTSKQRLVMRMPGIQINCVSAMKLFCWQLLRP